MSATVAFATTALALLASVQPAAGWTLVLADSATASGAVIRVGDVARGTLPSEAAQIVISPTGKPGGSAEISRQLILRRLVAAGQAAGMRFGGADICQVTFAGSLIDSGILSQRIQACVTALLPPAPAQAPLAWCSVELPELELAIGGAWEVTLADPRRLVPGRNLVPVKVSDGQHNYRFSATVTLHAFGEIAQPAGRIARDAVLTAEQLVWEWRDLTTVPTGLAVGRDDVLGSSAARDLAAGEPLRKADLKPTPLIVAGESIELRIGRGRVAAAVRAVARQSGRLGQIISVRNELTGRLVTARVAGPGLVEWSR